MSRLRELLVATREARDTARELERVANSGAPPPKWQHPDPALPVRVWRRIRRALEQAVPDLSRVARAVLYGKGGW